MTNIEKHRGDVVADGPLSFQETHDVSRETLDRLEFYAARLTQWQKSVNLVAPGSLRHIWRRHFSDSAQLIKFAPKAKIWVDLGSGAGFPGLVIAILFANRQDTRVHLVESNTRKCAFLAEVARETGAPATVHQTRIESFAEDLTVPDIDVVTARAVAPLDRLLQLAEPLFSRTSVGLFPKGRRFDQELRAAAQNWVFDIQHIPSCTDPDAKILKITDLAPRRNNESQASR